VSAADTGDEVGPAALNAGTWPSSLVTPRVRILTDNDYCGDPDAAQVVFNDSNLNLWQVPRDAYRQVIASRAELIVRLRSTGLLGEFLFDALGSVVARVHQMGRGDSPLVSLPVLQAAFEPGPASNEWVSFPCPRITDSGLYEQRSDGRPLRVFTRLDTRVLLEDLYAKLTLFAAGARSTATSDLGSRSAISAIHGDQ
jgi:purine nucleosidase